MSQSLRVKAAGSQVFMYLEVMPCTESHMPLALLLEQISVFLASILKHTQRF